MGIRVRSGSSAGVHVCVQVWPEVGPEVWVQVQVQMRWCNSECGCRCRDTCVGAAHAQVQVYNAQMHLLMLLLLWCLVQYRIRFSHAKFKDAELEFRVGHIWKKTPSAKFQDAKCHISSDIWYAGIFYKTLRGI